VGLLVGAVIARRTVGSERLQDAAIVMAGCLILGLAVSAAYATLRAWATRREAWSESVGRRSPALIRTFFSTGEEE